MKKLSVLLYSICLLGISLYGSSNHSYYVQLLMNLSRPYMFIRTTMVIILAVYAFVPGLRLYVTKALLGIGGIMLLSLGLVTMCSPSLLGHATSYTLPGDSLTLIEGGILAVVLSAELSARRSRFAARSFLYVHSLFAMRPRKLIYNPPLQLAKMLKTVLTEARAKPVGWELASQNKSL